MAVGPRLIALSLISRMSRDERRALLGQVIAEGDAELAVQAIDSGVNRISDLCAPHGAGRLCEGAVDA